MGGPAGRRVSPPVGWDQPRCGRTTTDGRVLLPAGPCPWPGRTTWSAEKILAWETSKSDCLNVLFCTPKQLIHRSDTGEHLLLV